MYSVGRIQTMIIMQASINPMTKPLQDLITAFKDNEELVSDIHELKDLSDIFAIKWGIRITLMWEDYQIK